METIDLSKRTQTGIELAGKCLVVGALKKPTRNHTDENPQYYYQVKLTPEDDENHVLFAFCSEDVARDAAARLAKEQAPYLADVVLLVSRGSRGTNINVESLA